LYTLSSVCLSAYTSIFWIFCTASDGNIITIVDSDEEDDPFYFDRADHLAKLVATVCGRQDDHKEDAMGGSNNDDDVMGGGT